MQLFVWPSENDVDRKRCYKQDARVSPGEVM
jgi:hypothetical protein